MSDKFIVNTKTTINHGGQRYTPIMIDHGKHREILLLVRTDEDMDFTIANMLCEFLNETVDQSDLPDSTMPNQLTWAQSKEGSSLRAQHPDFPNAAYYLTPSPDGSVEAKLSDDKDVRSLGGFGSLGIAQAACESHLATNRATRKAIEL